MKCTGILFLVLVGTFPGAARAQSFQLSLGAGAAFPTGNFRGTDRAGWLGSAAVSLGSGESGLGFRLEGMYGETGHKAPNTGKTRLLGGMGDIVFQIPGAGASVKPYLVSGAGVFRVRSDLAPSGTSRATGFTWEIGAGLAFPLGPANLFVEWRYLTILNQGSHTSCFPLSAGFLLGW